MYHYLYLIQDMQYPNTNIYKIGKTTQLPDRRFKGYINGTYPIRIANVDDCNIREKELICLFNNKFKRVKGREYFSGMLNDMIYTFNTFCDKYIPNIISNVEYKCNNCNNIFVTKQSLKKHINKKNKCNIITDFKCTKCDRYFKQKKNLLEHCEKNKCILMNKLKISIDDIFCKKCNMIFTSKCSLERHLNKKNKCDIITDYKCKRCNKYFKKKNNLLMHQWKDFCMSKKEIINNVSTITDNISHLHTDIKNILSTKCTIDENTHLID